MSVLNAPCDCLLHLSFFLMCRKTDPGEEQDVQPLRHHRGPHRHTCDPYLRRHLMYITRVDYHSVVRGLVACVCGKHQRLNNFLSEISWFCEEFLACTVAARKMRVFVLGFYVLFIVCVVDRFLGGGQRGFVLVAYLSEDREDVAIIRLLGGGQAGEIQPSSGLTGCMVM